MCIPEILLSLFILNLGIAFGAGIYETRIVLPLWFSKTPSGYQVNLKAMNDIETGRKFWGFVTTLPLTLLTIANLVVGWQSTEPMRTWWLVACFITLLERIGTFSFFIPTAIQLSKSENLPAEQVSAKVTWWIRLNLVRNTLTLMACLAALHSLALY